MKLQSFTFLSAAILAMAAANASAVSIRANTPASRLDAWWTARHAEKVAAVADASVKKDVVFLGDELVQGWETTGAGALATYFTGDRTMFNLGFAGDCTENVLWRIRNGELGSPKVVFLMVGGNNAAIYTEKEEPEGKTYLGVREIIDDLVGSIGASKVVVQAVLPRGLDESDPVRPRNDRLNIDVRAYAQKKGCAWVDMSDLFLENDHHTLKTSLFNDDLITLNADGYEVWAQAVAPYVAAAAGGSAMPADLVATARPEIDRIAAFPTAVNADLQDAFWRKFEDDLKLIGENGRSFDLVLLGDSLTQKWMEGNSASSMNGLAASVLNLGRTGDFVENLLWRLEGGCIDGYTTKFFNLLIGTNNTIQKNPSDTPEDIAAGVRAVLDLVLEKHPESKVLLMPILPYGYTNAQNAAKGAAQYANNEAANEIIRTFADGERVILVDVRSQFLNADGTYRGEMYVQLAGGDFPDMFLHLTPKAYEEILAPAIANAMAAAGASSVALPTIGSAAAQVSGTNATIALSGVAKGTDASGAAASSFTVSYKLDAGAEVALSTTETGSSASVQFNGLDDGWHTCAVWVSSDGIVKSAVKRVKFQIDSQADAVGWKVAPMDATGAAFRSDGTQVFARGYTGHTVNGVSFSAGFPGSDQATVSPSSYTGAGWTENNPVFNGGWVWEKSDSSLDLAFTLQGLTAGKKYLVQILAANHWNNSSTTLSAGDLVPFEATKQNDYKCGAVISRVFEATGAQETVTVTFATSGSKCLVKAIQLRELGDGGGGGGGGATVVAPSIGSVSATTNSNAATISLSNVVMGTDDEGATASSYSIAYSLNGASAVTALSNQTGATASFQIADLADGEYACAVSITTDKNKTSAEKTVSFRIGTPPPPVVAPSIGLAAASVVSSNATITLSDIVLGTDDEGAAATSYAVSYALNGGAAVAALANQTAASASFQIADLADGSYTCEVTVTTDKGKTATKTASFVVSTSGGGGGSVEEGWTVGPMAADGSTIRTDGTLLYAYCSPGGTVGGVPFARAVNLDAATMVSASPASAGNSGGSFGDGGATGDFGNMLRDGWYWTGEEVPLSFTLTLSGLTAGHAYLVQLVSHRTSNSTTVSANGSTPVYIHGTHDGVDYTYGASLVGVFTATGATADITVTYPTGTGNRPLNALQVRDLGEAGGGGSGGGGSGGGETVEPIVPGPDTTNTLYLAKIAEYAFASNGCGAITYSGQGGVFYVLQDHDDDNYARIHPLALGIDPSTGAILSQTLGTAFTPAGLRDGEGLALDPLSGTLWASSEWTPPSISEFGTDGTATGRTAPVPAIQRDKLRSNLSLESLTISPDGLTMWTANEQALTCDGKSSSGNTNVATVVRLTRFTRVTAQDNWQAAGEWAYACDPCANATFAECGLSGLCALPDGSLLALEREVSVATWGRCRIYRITTGALAAATEVSNVSSLTNATVSLVAKGSPLVSFTGTDLNNIIVYEGIALGPQLGDGSYGVYLVSDGGATKTKSLGPITVTAKTVSRICALKLTGRPFFLDWPANPDRDIPDETLPSDLCITNGSFATSATTVAELRKLAKWAKKNGVPYAGADVNAMSFDADGNPDNALSAAYLLNCAATGLDEAKAAFRFAGIDPGTVPSIAGAYNGTVTVYGADAPSGPWQPATDLHHFYRAILTR